MHERPDLAAALAFYFERETLDIERLVECGSKLLGKRYDWLQPLCERMLQHFRGGRPRARAICRLIAGDEGFRRACEQDEELQIVSGPPKVRPGLRPAAGLPATDVPSLLTLGQVAQWLEIAPAELDWFADRRELERKRDDPRLRHYVYRVLAKRFGRVRLIEAPKLRLREIQRRILHGILDQVPLHDAAHGFRRGRSIKTFAAPHVGQAVVLRLDLEDFFPSLTLARARAIFWTLGYPARVANVLAALCTNSAPDFVWDELARDVPPDHLRQARWLYAAPHLPQGAPTSPALANLAAYRLDCRLTALAAAAGGVYTRYADDLAFSGDDSFARGIERFRNHVCATVMEERFRVNFRKLRIMRRGVRQHLAGVVVNSGTNVRRADYDDLKATLHNCVRIGPEEQNRAEHADFRAHLLGRIAHVTHLNAARGHKLRQIFAAITWS
jgi:hypothetical protein